jgi:hypothetical protein
MGQQGVDASARQEELSIQQCGDGNTPPGPKCALSNVWVSADPGGIRHAAPNEFPRVQKHTACSRHSTACMRLDCVLAGR